MGEREYDDTVRDWPVHDCKGEVFEEDAPRTLGCGRTRKRKGDSASRSLFHSGGKTRAEARLLFVVVDDFGKKLPSRGRDELGFLHRVKRRASANTSSAA